MSVPIEIRDRYTAGEREIRVSPQTYQDYSDGLIPNERLHQPDERKADTEEWLWYKDAKVKRWQR